ASGPARRPLGAGCEELADAGRCAGPMKRGRRSEKCRGGAPRGAPAGVIGRMVSLRRGDRPCREAGHGHGVPCQRLSALRSPRFGSKREAGVPRAAKNRGDEVCQNLKSNLAGWAKTKARTLTLTRHDGHRAFAHLAASPSRREWSASSRKWPAPTGGQPRPPPCPTTMLEQRLCPPYQIAQRSRSNAETIAQDRLNCTRFGTTFTRMRDTKDGYLIKPDPLDPKLTERVTGVDQTGQPIETRVTVERALTIFLNAQEIVTAMTINDYPDYLALGYLLNQHMLLPDDVVTGIDYDEELAVVVVRTKRKTNYEKKLKKKVQTSGCAQGTVFGDLMEALENVKLPAAELRTSWLYALTNTINTTPSLYLEAGAIH